MKSIINYACSVIFIVEVILKITAEGPRDYFKEQWNQFDFTISFSSIVSMVIDLTTPLNIGSKFSIIRTLRGARILRMIKNAKVLRMIIDTFIITVPSFVNMGGLLFLILFIYAVLGVQLFAPL